jgi:hypothetical protein
MACILIASDGHEVMPHASQRSARSHPTRHGTRRDFTNLRKILVGWVLVRFRTSSDAQHAASRREPLPVCIDRGERK